MSRRLLAGSVLAGVVLVPSGAAWAAHVPPAPVPAGVPVEASGWRCETERDAAGLDVGEVCVVTSWAEEPVPQSPAPLPNPLPVSGSVAVTAVDPVPVQEVSPLPGSDAAVDGLRAEVVTLRSSAVLGLGLLVFLAGAGLAVVAWR